MSKKSHLNEGSAGWSIYHKNGAIFPGYDALIEIKFKRKQPQVSLYCFTSQGVEQQELHAAVTPLASILDRCIWILAGCPDRVGSPELRAPTCADSPAENLRVVLQNALEYLDDIAKVDS